MTVEEGRQLGLRKCADLGGGELAALEQHQGRDAADAELGGHVAVVVNVQFRDLQAERKFCICNAVPSELAPLSARSSITSSLLSPLNAWNP